MKITHLLPHSLILVALLAWLSPAQPLVAQESTGTFMIKAGEFPWSDRVNVWQLAEVPAKLEGNGPLPQQNCGSRSIVVPDQSQYILFGVCTKDVEKFQTLYPEAKVTGDSISVIHPDGTGTLPYTIFKLANPPASMGDKSLLAGLILLQINDKPGKPSDTSPSAPAPSK